MNAILLTSLSEAGPQVTPTWPLLAVAVAVLVAIETKRLTLWAIRKVRHD